ncbi:DUF2690 domain-containing protein [Streptomyces sp. NBC_00207]|uniref:DUF2690 domain-containing protein n=1 Tax=unclassified Streptomyces TaxID=2593676 RepID=UPI0032444862
MDPASHGRGGGVGHLCEPGPTAENKRSGAQLRYSPSCRAAWGRFKINVPSGSRMEVKNSQGRKYTDQRQRQVLQRRDQRRGREGVGLRHPALRVRRHQHRVHGRLPRGR